MELTRGKVKQIIREEMDRLTIVESSSAGKEMAEKIISEYNGLSLDDKRVFLANFVQFLNKESA